MIYRRDGRPRSVWGCMNRECRVLRCNQISTKELFLFKPQSIAFCTLVAQVRKKSGLLFSSKQTSVLTTRKQLQQHESPLARSLRDCRLADNSERRRRPSKASSLIRKGDDEAVTFPSRRMPVSCTVYPYVFLLCFPVLLVCKFSSSRYERRGDFSTKDGSDWDA